MEERGDDTKMLKNEKWLTDLAFLTDITMHLNTINFQLQAEDKYPNLRQIALQLTTMFGSTYLCESAFSEMKIIKSKYRNRLTDEHMSSCLRLALGNYVPSYEKYAEDMQCHASTSKVTL
ncbi:general transcription factor II-I repeat domain-containing protein 2A-like [Harmonia axyridis]|nr:general transcription factor II-I repeat domain-containing protein 2A-like [Harmonia axyridis]